jgi:hypothetical protein
VRIFLASGPSPHKPIVVVGVSGPPRVSISVAVPLATCVSRKCEIVEQRGGGKEGRKEGRKGLSASRRLAMAVMEMAGSIP